MTIDLDQLAERVEALENEVESLENELEAEREQRQKLEALVDDRTPDDEEGSNLTDVYIADVPVGRVLNETDKRVSKLERKTTPAEPGEPEAVDDFDEAAPPIYTLLQTPEPNLKPTERRTRFLWKDLGDYARKAPVGLVLSASDAKRVLNAAEPDESDADRITSKQVGRVFYLMKDLTRDVAEIREKGGERQLVVPDGWEDRARDAAPDTAVS